MTSPRARPSGMPWLSPHLTVRDAAAAIDFYQRAFGFEKKSAVTSPDGQILHAEMTWQDAVIMLGPEGAYGNLTKAPATSGVPSPVTLYLYCEDVDALYARATAAGAVAVFPPQDMFYGDRLCKLLDPEGHSWHFATRLEEETQEPTAH